MNQKLTTIARALGWGVLAGGVGFTLGLLLAPEKGQNIRLRISYHLNALAKQARGLAEQWAEYSPEGMARNESQAIVEKAREGAAEISSRIDEIIGGVPEEHSNPPR